jgi:glycosyltransferase involved in cell wall biosynthesis
MRIHAVANGAVAPTQPELRPDLAVPNVSVVIPVHNGARRLQSLLDALARQTAPRKAFEVIFIDDASTDETAEFIRASGAAEVVVSPSRRGSYAARNLGLSRARAEIVAFTDSDCIPAPNWIETGLAELDRTEADMLAGQVDMPLGDRPTIAALVDAWRFLDQRRWVRRNFGATANLWVRQDVFRRVGCFREDLISGGDAEFGHRATRSGAKLRYAERLIVSHPPRDRAQDLARKGFRTGVGAAQQFWHGNGPLRERGRTWLRPGRYVPHERVRGIDRLTGQGYYPTALERIEMFWMHYFALKLPHTFGNLVGDVAEACRSRRGGRRHASTELGGDPVI